MLELTLEERGCTEGLVRESGRDVRVGGLEVRNKLLLVDRAVVVGVHCGDHLE